MSPAALDGREVEVLRNCSAQRGKGGNQLEAGMSCCCF